MKRGIVAVVLALALPGLSVSAEASGAPAPPAAMRAQAKAPYVGPDITLDSSAYFQLSSNEVGGALVDIETSTSAARSDAMAAWQPWATLTAVRSLELPIAAGQVVCVRYRAHYPEDLFGPWFQQCTARGWRDEAFATRGDVAEVPARDLPGGDGLSLGRGGRLVVPDLLPGMHVAAVLGVDLPGDPAEDYRSVAEWRDPSGTPTPVVRFLSPFERLLLHTVAAAGSGRFVTQARKGTFPVGAVVVFPAWYPFDIELRPPTTLALASPLRVQPDLLAEFTPAGIALLRFTGAVPPGWRRVVQVRRGDSRHAAPRWRQAPLPAFATGLEVRLRAGFTVCARVRVVSPSGDVRTTRPWCLSRPYDDSVGRARGRADQVVDPYFADRRATRLRPYAEIRLPRVRRGSVAGFVYTTSRPLHPPRVEISLPGRRGWDSSSGIGETRRGWPSAQWGLVRRTGTVRIRTVSGYDRGEDVSALIVVPAWARRWASPRW